MEETIVMRREMHPIEFAKRSKFPQGRIAGRHGTIRLQHLNRVIFNEIAASEDGPFALAGRERNLRLPCQKTKLPMIVLPSHGLLEPANIERLQQSRAFDRRLQGPAPVDVDHQIIVRSDQLAYGFDPRNVFVQRQSTYLGLERAMALRLELLDFILDV